MRQHFTVLHRKVTLYHSTLILSLSSTFTFSNISRCLIIKQMISAMYKLNISSVTQNAKKLEEDKALKNYLVLDSLSFHSF